MSRNLAFSIALLCVVTMSGAARAASYISWCFQWLAAYDDMGFGEDNLTGGDIPARYNMVRIKNMTTGVATTVWLNSTGCTSSMLVESSTTYEFQQYTRARKDNRDVFLIPDGQAWESYVTYINQWNFTTGRLLPGPLPPHTFSSPAPEPAAGENLNRLMPVFAHVLHNSGPLDWEDTVDIWVSTDPALGCGSVTGDGSQANRFHICIDDDWDLYKYQIAHEFGHVISKWNDGPDQGSRYGDEGVYEDTDPATADRCDCDVAWNGKSHCLGSREFTGYAQQEAFSHFVASAAMNNLSTSTSVFLYYFPVMEPSDDHYDDFTTVLPDPGADPDDTEGYPYYVPIDAAPGTKVRWMEYECAPGGFSHFGTEWDWLDFYWNLWTDGYPNRYTIAEINQIWDIMPKSRIQILCCPALPPWPPSPFPPDGCYEQPAGSSGCASGLIQVDIGATWYQHDGTYSPDCIQESAYNLWHSTNPTKYNNFQNYGIEAGVDY